jgi:hypothetical protein
MTMLNDRILGPCRLALMITASTVLHGIMPAGMSGVVDVGHVVTSGLILTRRERA